MSWYTERVDRQTVAVELYNGGFIAAGTAADYLDTTVEHFMKLVDAHKKEGTMNEPTREEIVIDLYECNEITANQAAILLQISVEEFMEMIDG